MPAITCKLERKQKSKDKEPVLQGFLLASFPRCNIIIMAIIIINSIMLQVLIADPIG